ncbi:hypothetical protein PR048_007876 [Dryococelus australis]|uniref:DUF7869 domain-containing protein n=1 Tax=Dryococelus australis TaxID=614101 RepID=A0ABQ9HVI3_9NEOP|nr:hypothetical protein PR048_007876 [Dryococelus australis]
MGRTPWELRFQGQEARERYGRHKHARLVPHNSHAQGVQHLGSSSSPITHGRWGRCRGLVRTLANHGMSGSIPHCVVSGFPHVGNMADVVIRRWVFSGCNWKCMPLRVSQDDLLEIYTKFIDFDSKNEQGAYLQSLIQCQSIKRKRLRCPVLHLMAQEKIKNPTHSNTPCQLPKIECKCPWNFQCVRRLCNLSEGKSPKDARGKNTPGNAKPGSVVKCIEDHIASFPTKQVHYRRKTFRYLSASLNVKKINKHWHFCDLQIFLENVSREFQPYVWKTASGHLSVLKSYLVRNQCLEDNQVAGICMDYTMNLQLPEIPVQEKFYMRKLAMNVFDIHEVETQSGIAEKGPNEVCSFLLDYINNEISPNVKHLHLFSDGAAGQNKNNSVVRLLLGVVETGRFQTIHHYFPIRGHSFLPCDRDLSVIKRKTKRTYGIYTPKEYIDLIAQSTVTPGKFTVQMVESKDILNFKDWWSKFYKRNVSYARSVPRDQLQHFNVSAFMEFVYSSDYIGRVQARPLIDGLIDHNLPTELACREGCCTMFPDSRVRYTLSSLSGDDEGGCIAVVRHPHEANKTTSATKRRRHETAPARRQTTGRGSLCHVLRQSDLLIRHVVKCVKELIGSSGIMSGQDIPEKEKEEMSGDGSRSVNDPVEMRRRRQLFP